MSRPQTQLQTIEHVTHPKRGARVAERKTEAHKQSLRQYTSATNKAKAALIDPEKPLTEQQRSFAKLWASGESVVTATLRAGYSSEVYGYRMAAQPNVLKLYNEEKAKYEKASDMSRKKVMDMLLKAYEHAEFAQEPASMVSAAREIGRMCGYYEPVKHRVEVNVTGNIVLDRMNRLTDAELLELLTKEDPAET